MNMQIEWVGIGSIKPYAKNARTHSADQVDQIAESIRRFGWTNPILVGDDGIVVAGHGRLMAAKKMGEKKVPIIKLSHLDADQRRAYVLADNRIAEASGWDKALLSEELAALDGLGFDLDFLDFPEIDGDLADQLSDAERETPEDRSDRLAGENENNSQEERNSINFPIYVILNSQEHKQWREMKGDRSDKEFITALLENADMIRDFYSQADDQ
jgi:ParB-like chromosome segregation protein Spo0J